MSAGLPFGFLADLRQALVHLECESVACLRAIEGDTANSLAHLEQDIVGLFRHNASLPRRFIHPELRSDAPDPKAADIAVPRRSMAMPPGREKPHRFSQIFFHDPDGNIIEVHQVDA